MKLWNILCVGFDCYRHRELLKPCCVIRNMTQGRTSQIGKCCDQRRQSLRHLKASWKIRRIYAAFFVPVLLEGGIVMAVPALLSGRPQGYVLGPLLFTEYQEERQACSTLAVFFILWKQFINISLIDITLYKYIIFKINLYNIILGKT